jgi:tetratricopeptide (TPR) repeat protein
MRREASMGCPHVGEVSRCEALSTLGRYADAVLQGRQCVALDASQQSGHAALGFALLKAEDFKASIDEFEEAQNLGDCSFQTNELLSLAHSARADAASHAGDFPLALESYEKALELMVPDAFTVRYNYAITLKNAGDKPKAILELERVVAEVPQHTEACYALAILKIQLSDFKGAKPHLEHAVALEPEDADRRYNWGILLQNLGDAKGAFRGRHPGILSLNPTPEKTKVPQTPSSPSSRATRATTRRSAL